jgi:hypothetical protein
VRILRCEKLALLGRPRGIREENVEMNLTEINVCAYTMDSYHSRKGRVAHSCEYGNVPSGYIKGSEFLD